MIKNFKAAVILAAIALLALIAMPISASHSNAAVAAEPAIDAAAEFAELVDHAPAMSGTVEVLANCSGADELTAENIFKATRCQYWE